MSSNGSKSKNILLNIRKSNNGTQQSVAKLLGKSQSSISEIEKKSNKELLGSIVDYADIYGLDVEIVISKRHRSAIEKIADLLQRVRASFSDVKLCGNETIKACVNGIIHSNLDYIIQLLEIHKIKGVTTQERGHSKLIINFDNKTLEEE